MPRGDTMLMQAATPEMVERWKAVHREYGHRLCPNRKTGAEVAAYLAGKYPLTEQQDNSAIKVVARNVLDNRCLAEKLPPGASPSPVAYIVRNEGSAGMLYDNQDECFKGMEILAGIDLASGYYTVEGSSLLWDELCAYQGLDEQDLKNCYCVAEYVDCLRRFGLLEKTLELQ